MLNKLKSSVLRSVMLLIITQMTFWTMFSAYAADSTSVTIEGTNITSSTTSWTSGSSWTGSNVNVTYNYEGALWSITSSLLSSWQKFRTWDMNWDGIPDIVVEKLVSSVKYLDLYVFRNGGYELASTVDTKTISRAFLGQGQASETGQLYSWVILALDANTKELCAPVYADYIAWKENLTDWSDYKKKLLPCLRKMNSSVNNTVRVSWDSRLTDEIFLWDELFLKIPINYTDSYWIDYYFIKDESGKWKLIVQVSFVWNNNNSSSYNRPASWLPMPKLPLLSGTEFQSLDSNWTFLISKNGSSTTPGRSSRRSPVVYLDTITNTLKTTGFNPWIRNGSFPFGSNKFAWLTLVLQTTTEMLNKPLEITWFASGKLGDTSYAALGYSTLSSKLITKADVNGDGVEDITVYKTDPKVNANIAAVYLYDTAQQIYVYSSGSGTSGSSGSGSGSTLNQDINNDTQEDALFTSKSWDYTTATYYINNAGTYNLALTIPEATIIEYKDLNQDDNTTLKGAKDIITTKKVNDKLFYKVYIYNKTSKTFISVLDAASTNAWEIEALSYLIQDVNWDWNLDIIFKKSDGKLYIYTYDTDWTGITWDVANSMKLLTSIDWDEFKFLTLDNNTSRDLVTRKYLGLFWGKKYYKFDVYFYNSTTKAYVKQHDENLLLGTDLNLFTDQDKAADLVDYNKDNIKDIVLEGATTKWIYYYSAATNKYVYLDKVNQTNVLADYLLWNDQTNTTYWKQVLWDDHLILIDNTWKVRHYYFNTTSKLYVDAAATYNGVTYWATSAINVNFGTKKLTDPKEFKDFTTNWKKIWVMKDKDNKLVIFKSFNTIKPDADNIVTGLVSTSDLNKADWYSFTNYLAWTQPLYVFASDTYKSVWLSWNNTKNILLLDWTSTLVSTTTIATIDSTTNVFHTYDWFNLWLNSASTKDIDKSIVAFIVKKVTWEAIPVTRIQKILDMWTITIPLTTKTWRTWTYWLGRNDSISETVSGITFKNQWWVRNASSTRQTGTEVFTINAWNLPALNVYNSTVIWNKIVTTSTNQISYFGNNLTNVIWMYPLTSSIDPNSFTSNSLSDISWTTVYGLWEAVYGGRVWNIWYRTPIWTASLILSSFRNTKPTVPVTLVTSDILDSTKDLVSMQNYNIVSTDTTWQTYTDTKTCQVSARTRLPRTWSCTITYDDNTTQSVSCLAWPGIRRRATHSCIATGTKTTTNLTKKDYYVKWVKDSSVLWTKVNTSYYNGATLFSKEKNFYVSPYAKLYFDGNTLSETALIDKITTSSVNLACWGTNRNSTRNLVWGRGNGSTLSGTRKSRNWWTSIYCLARGVSVRWGWSQTNAYLKFATSN